MTTKGFWTHQQASEQTHIDDDDDNDDNDDENNDNEADHN